MMRFHFNSKDGQCFLDEEGTMLADSDAAKAMAVQILSEQLHGNQALLLHTGDYRIIVTDDAGTTLMTIKMSIDMAPASGD